MNKTNIIITGEEFDYSFDKLKAMEVNIFHYPMIFTSGIDMTIDPNIYNYIIFTSKNGVKYFLKNISTSINLFKEILQKKNFMSAYPNLLILIIK